MNNISMLKKISIITGSVLAAIYVLFLVLPLFLSGVLNSYSGKISEMVEAETGFKLKLEKMKIVTTPKLTAGIKIGHTELMMPTSDKILSADNFQVKLSLIPILIGRIELDQVAVENVDVSLNVLTSGRFLFEDYLPKTEKEETAEPIAPLPLGIKLSNHLPNIEVKNYNISFIDNNNDDTYSIKGDKFRISDFILNKKIKVITDGKVVLKDKTQFNYDIDVFNKIMPDIDLNELVFAPAIEISAQQTEEIPQIDFNIIKIFKAIYANQLTADLKTNIKITGDAKQANLDGYLNVDKLGIAVNSLKLPDSNIDVDFAGNKIDMDVKLYSALSELTELTGKIKTGKKANIDLTCKSNAGLSNIFAIVRSVAKSFGINDLDTLTAKGALDVDFNLKSDMKKIQSNGHLKLNSGNLAYGLYNVSVNDINANVSFDDNKIDIKNAGLSIAGYPLKIYGTVTSDAVADLHVLAEKIQIKGLLATAGQVQLLKENDFRSGDISLNASLKGKLDKPEPKVKLLVNNVNIKNIPSDTTVSLGNTNVDITAETNKIKGLVSLSQLRIVNPMAVVSVPETQVTISEKDIVIDKAYALLNNSRIDVTGKIADYMTKKINFDIKANGNILGNDIRLMIPAELRSDVRAAGSMPLTATITGNEKSQEVNVKLTATPSGYVSIIDVDLLSGKNTLINTNLKIANDSVKISDTGIFINDLSNPLVIVKGSVNNIANPKLNNITVSVPKQAGISIPGFKGSKALAKGDISVNGSVNNPSIKGNISVPLVSIPTIKTTLKNITADLSNTAINVNCPNIAIDNSVMNGKGVVSTNFAKGIVVNSMTFNADYIDADTAAKAMEGLPPTAPATSSGSGGSTAEPDLGITVLSGKGSITKLKSGGIIAENLSGDFNLNNNTLYIKNINGDAFSGKVKGSVSYGVMNEKIGVDMTGTGMNAVTAIEGAAGIKNALSGKLGWNAKLNLKGLTEEAMMKSLKGTVIFNIDDGTFGNIGRLENLLGAENIMSNVIMKTALSGITALPAVKNTAEFKYITGSLSFANGWADLNPIKTSGPSMSYYITGKYNLLNGTANLVILGRLSAEVVGLLGPIGDLSVDKLTSYLPKFGNLTSAVIKTMTASPQGENISEIPQLSSGNSKYKDFKVVFNGGIESKSSVKSFKWLSNLDASEVEKLDVKEQLQGAKDALETLKNQKVTETMNKVQEAKTQSQAQLEEAKKQTEAAKQKILDTKNEINNLKNLFKN